ncbi:MAG: methylated-DNA--[protein]-cysteine S-methyltransferase [Proteobacteria bacterium]|nr:methylated-DNA--[protein]-cysteine S-methyltransferase [Pseudomonadota bacterium]
MPQLTFPSPVGWLSVTEEAGVIVRVAWRRGGEADLTPLLIEARRQIEAYLAGELASFDLPHRAEGSRFEQLVWQEMLKIPCGKTRTYGDIALATGAPARAVGQACGRNPIPLIIPCHRVLGADGLGGFSGGEGRPTKRWLLTLEQRMTGGPSQGDLFAASAVTSP